MYIGSKFYWVNFHESKHYTHKVTLIQSLQAQNAQSNCNIKSQMIQLISANKNGNIGKKQNDENN